MDTEAKITDLAEEVGTVELTGLEAAVLFSRHYTIDVWWARELDSLVEQSPQSRRVLVGKFLGLVDYIIEEPLVSK